MKLAIIIIIIVTLWINLYNYAGIIMEIIGSTKIVIGEYKIFVLYVSLNNTCVCNNSSCVQLLISPHRRIGWGGHTPPLIKSAVRAKEDFN